MSPRRTGSLKRIEFAVLAVLRDGPLHGYGIVQEIERRTGGEIRVRPGSLYRVLDRLVRMGLLTPAPEADSAEHDRRTHYRTTDAGSEALIEEARVLAALAADVLGPAGEPA